MFLGKDGSQEFRFPSKTLVMYDWSFPRTKRNSPSACAGVLTAFLLGHHFGIVRFDLGCRTGNLWGQ
eukprot:9051882-Lingulodinium_polyedra.AAC.1